MSNNIDWSKICFVIMKFGKKESEEYAEQKALYEDIIKPAVEEAGQGYKCLRADEIMRPTSIIKDIVVHLRQADIVIADLTGQNPNVFYELGVRHALKGRTIMLTQNMDDVPFDVRNYRVIEYLPSNPSGFRKVTKDIRKHLEELSEDQDMMDSPVIDTLSTSNSLTDEKSHSIDASERRDMIVVRGLIDGLIRRFDAEVASRLESFNVDSENSVRAVEELVGAQHKSVEHMNQILAQLRPDLLGEMKASVDKISRRVEEIGKAEDLALMGEKYGLTGIYRTRLEAIEQAIYPIMEMEDKQIDIVGSTIFGLKGNNLITTKHILDLLQKKIEASDKFTVRILLTHYEYLSTRIEQERNVKSPDRYVISREAVKAIDELRNRDLLHAVRFYKGAPTCFTVACHGQKQMLLNPYPYEKEAYSSWAIVFREVPSGIYQDFLIAHVEYPWSNQLLTESYSDVYERSLIEKAESDRETFFREGKKQQKAKR